MLLSAIGLVLVVAPLLYAVVGAWHSRGEASGPGRGMPGWTWRLSAASTLCYVLAFNLAFFVQELFLVLPKAILPGVRPVLFHNNHAWQGTHAAVELFQGTGALATLLLGLGCATWLRRRRPGSPSVQLLLFWLAFCGVYMALPQVVLGAIEPRGDVGRAMDWLELALPLKGGLALLALLGIAGFAQLLAKPLFALAAQPAWLATAGRRHRFVFLAATLPALAGSVLAVPFRVPREWTEVLLVPAMVAVCGLAWLQAGAWRAPATGTASRGQHAWPLARLLMAVCALLAVFQLVLRHGIAFG